jgi:hypothetical protein
VRRGKYEESISKFGIICQIRAPKFSSAGGPKSLQAGPAWFRSYQDSFTDELKCGQYETTSLSLLCRIRKLAQKPANNIAVS